jgi:hypothetical protein
MKSITQKYANEELQKSIQERIQAQIKEKVEKTIASNLLKASLFSEETRSCPLTHAPTQRAPSSLPPHHNNEVQMGRADADRGYVYAYAGNLHILNPFAGGKEYREAARRQFDRRGRNERGGGVSTNVSHCLFPRLIFINRYNA